MVAVLVAVVSKTTKVVVIATGVEHPQCSPKRRPQGLRPGGDARLLWAAAGAPSSHVLPLPLPIPLLFSFVPSLLFLLAKHREEREAYVVFRHCPAVIAPQGALS